MKRIYYQRLAIPIIQLESKCQFKRMWMAAPPKAEKKELVLYLNRNAMVAELPSRHLVFEEEGGSGKLRMVEIFNKIIGLSRADQTLERLQVGGAGLVLVQLGWLQVGGTKS